MTYRGRGCGGFSGGGGFGFAKQEPFVLFPVKKTHTLTEEENLINQTRKFQNIWKGFPYYLEQSPSNEKQNMDVERYSDRTKPKTTIRRVRWNPDSDLVKLDLFEKLEQCQGQNDAKEKKECEGEDVNENEEEAEPEDEDFSDDDYCKNSDFKDDEDDYNMEDDGDGRTHLSDPLQFLSYCYNME
ncbi:DNA-directed RNA polymerase III subunit rpc31 [Pyrus ussuriensis x Pyrus communis]|uniref:DNA-directed RNA polymerase III subunit rpc31 n=1 Tax=Pyrus ussuriensis x Pyrus communis TaxID=2448454 RepID=A0A5N5HNF5_9ROSA|nr:DNA-directed RNA polymerase III subunit rpc31 [Pyrus ussuriensis x Pyrus communis]